jgi:hypothetical protein
MLEERILLLLDQADARRKIRLPSSFWPDPVDQSVTYIMNCRASGPASRGIDPVIGVRTLFVILWRTFTLVEAAQHLQCSEQDVVSLVDTHELGGLVCYGRSWLLSRTGVERLAREPHFVGHPTQRDITRQGGA